MENFYGSLNEHRRYEKILHNQFDDAIQSRIGIREESKGLKLFLEIANILEAEIFKGTYLPGSRFPSVRSLADRMGASEGTIQNTLRYLKDKKLVIAKNTRGYFVNDDGAYIQRMREREVSRLVWNLYRSLRNLGMSDSEIEEFFNKEVNR